MLQLRQKSFSPPPKGGDLILGPRLQSELRSIRKSSINFFIPFAIERSHTGKLLPKPSTGTERIVLKQCHRVEGSSPVKVLKPLAFGHTLQPSLSRVRHDRYPSPPPGTYTPVWPQPHIETRKQPRPRSRFGQMHVRAHSMDFISADALNKKKHITGVDMAKLLARDKEVGMDMNELLTDLNDRLPAHVRKFKGFYEASALKSSGMEKPQVLMRDGDMMTDDIQKRMQALKLHLT